jgi:hypothetical protein
VEDVERGSEGVPGATGGILGERNTDMQATVLKREEHENSEK